MFITGMNNEAGVEEEIVRIDVDERPNVIVGVAHPHQLYGVPIGTKVFGQGWHDEQQADEGNKE